MNSLVPIASGEAVALAVFRRPRYQKKTDLPTVNADERIKSLFFINSKPKKCLVGKTPIQVLLHEV